MKRALELIMEYEYRTGHKNNDVICTSLLNGCKNHNVNGMTKIVSKCMIDRFGV